MFLREGQCADGVDCFHMQRVALSSALHCDIEVGRLQAPLWVKRSHLSVEDGDLYQREGEGCVGGG